MRASQRLLKDAQNHVKQAQRMASTLTNSVSDVSSLYEPRSSLLMSENSEGRLRTLGSMYNR